MTDFAGKNVLITGGAQGLGRLVAERAIARGARVILWDIAREQLDETVSELGSSAYGYLVDITDRERVYEAAEQVRDEVGEVDVLVNNAGIVTGQSFLDLPDEMIERTFSVNSLSLFWLTKAFLPSMVRRGEGHVVTIASVAGMLGVEKLADYCASKFAAVGFDESLRIAMKTEQTGVQTTVVCPYFIDTGMFDGVKSRVPFLLPILQEDDVADKIVRAIERNTEKLIMPKFASLLPIARILPTPMFDALMTLIGVNSSMDEFVGHGEKPATDNGFGSRSAHARRKLFN